MPSLGSIATARKRIAARTPRVAVKLATDKSGASIDFNAFHDDRDGLIYRLQNAFGSRGQAFTSAELNNLVQAAQLADGQTDETRLNAFLAVVDGCASRRTRSRRCSPAKSL